MRVSKFLALTLALIIPLLVSAPAGAAMEDRWSETTELGAGPEVLVMRNASGQLFFRSLSGTPAGDFDLTGLTLRAIVSKPGTFVSGSSLFRVYFIEDVNNDIWYSEVDLSTPTPTVTQTLVAEAVLLGFIPRNVAITQQHVGVINWLAVSSDDDSIYMLPGQSAPDYANISSITLQPPVPNNTANQICYINPEAMGFDFTGRFLAYDAISCLEDVAATCPTTAAGCSGTPYYSIGVTDLTDFDGTTGEVFDHPLQSDNSNSNMANPDFGYFNNWTMAFDLVTSVDNEVYAVDFKSGNPPQAVAKTLINGTGPTFGSPSHFIDDVGILSQGDELLAIGAWNDPTNEIYAIEQLPIDINTPAASSVLLASGFDSHTILRVGERSITVDPQPQPLDFGAITEGGSSSLFLAISNAGTRSFIISSATLTDTSHYQIATPLPIEVSAQGINFIRVDYNAGAVVGTFNDQLQLVADVPGGLLTVDLLASTVADTTGGGGTTPTDPTPDDTTDTTDGTAHDEGDFIGPCFIGALN